LLLDVPPTHMMHGKSFIVAHVIPADAQTVFPPLIQSSGEQIPPVVMEEVEDLLLELSELFLAEERPEFCVLDRDEGLLPLLLQGGRVWEELLLEDSIGARN